MRYAKLIDNYPSYAPRKLHVGNDWVFNPTAEMLTAAGYLPVIESDYPEVEDNFYAESHWAEKDGQIVQTWEIVEIPITDEDALVRYSNELTGANDQTISEAAETMIHKLMEE